jgi:hypothetical protein
MSTHRSGNVRSASADPTHDGAEVSSAVIDRVRSEMLHRVGLDELLSSVKY